jgi:uncharacterized protein YjbJ (UPF0337 family)
VLFQFRSRLLKRAVVARDPANETKEFTMTAADNIKNKMQSAKGKIKKEAGKIANDQALEAEGRNEQVSGDLKQAGEKVKDAVKS